MIWKKDVEESLFEFIFDTRKKAIIILYVWIQFKNMKENIFDNVFVKSLSCITLKKISSIERRTQIEAFLRIILESLNRILTYVYPNV